MEKCSECGKLCEAGSITGQMEGTEETKTLCWLCFNNKYELVRTSKINVFKKKKGGKN